MPLSSRSVLQWTTTLFIIGLVPLVAILVVTAWLISDTARTTEAVIAAREARSSIVDLKSLVQDAEIGQRGFLLTGRESYLQPFEQAKSEIPARFATLRERLTEDASAAQLGELSTKMDAKLAELSQTIELARQGRIDDALVVVESDVGKAAMDQARELFDRLTADADRRFAESVVRQGQSARALQWTEAIGAVVILLLAGGAAWIVALYTRDLTSARKEIEFLNAGLEDKVRDRTVELGRANDEIQRFAYIVTHDLRAPLVNIMGFTSELETSLAPIRTLVADLKDEGRELHEDINSAVEDTTEAIGFIRSSTTKMDGLINAILRLSREGRRQLKPEAVRLRPLLETARDAIQHQVSEAGGQIDLEIGLQSIVSDRISLEQVIGNLLDNATKYSAPDRPLRVVVRVSLAPGDRAIIEVEDNGRGIAENDHERIFELFRRSGNQDQPGEGIGLAHVRSSIRGMGGDITLTSRLGSGTRFKIDLPRDLSKTIGGYPS